MIKYIGKKHLNSNFYKQITLKKGINYIEVKTIADERIKKSELLKLDTKSITEQIDNLSDYDKVKEIILYFLRNNKICEISQEKGKIVVVSTSSTKLILQLDIKYKKLLELIIDQYQNDRLKFIDNCDESVVYIRSVHWDKNFNVISGTTSYFEGMERFSKEPALVLTLASNKSDIAPFDKEFVMNYIKELIDKSEKYIRFNRTEIDGNLYVDYKKIRIPCELVEEVNKMVLNRNSQIYEMNGRQYKLEGIK